MCILRGEFHRQDQHKARAFESNFGLGGRNLNDPIFKRLYSGGEVEVSTRSVQKKCIVRGLSTQCCDKIIFLQRQKAAVLLHSTTFPVTKVLCEK